MLNESTNDIPAASWYQRGCLIYRRDTGLLLGAILPGHPVGAWQARIVGRHLSRCFVSLETAGDFLWREHEMKRAATYHPRRRRSGHRSPLEVLAMLHTPMTAPIEDYNDRPH